MYEIIVIATIFLGLTGYGAFGGYLAAKNDIQHVHEALLWSYFWPYLIWGNRNGKKKTN